MKSKSLLVGLSILIATGVLSKECQKYVEYVCGKDRCCTIKDGQRICQDCNKYCDDIQTVECYHGECGFQGCYCNPCWKGEHCDIFDNQGVPEFTREEYVAYVLPGDRDSLRGVAAFDPDRKHCVHKFSHDCPCGDITYVLVEGEDLPWRFRINPVTGAINYNLLDRDKEEDYPLLIAAVNTLANGSLDMSDAGFAKVILKARRNARDLTEASMLELLHPKYDTISWSGAPDGLPLLKLHRRKKRAVGPGLPDELFTNLTQIGGVTSLNTVDSAQLQLVISVPEGTENLNVSIDTTSAGALPVFTLCGVVVTSVGSNFGGLTVSDVVIEYSSSANNNELDQATLTFGSITNDATDVNNVEANQIVITFRVIVLENPSVSSGDVHSVFTSTYRNESFALVQQADYDIQPISVESGVAHVISVSGPASLSVGVAASWRVDVVIKDGITKLSIDGFSKAANPVHICSVTFLSAGNNYGCSMTSGGTQTISSSGPENGMQVDFGTVVNLGFQNNSLPDSASTISVIVTGYIPENGMVGQDYEFSVSVIDNGITEENTFFLVTAEIQDTAPPTLAPTLSVMEQKTAIQVGGRGTLDVKLGVAIAHTVQYDLSFFATAGNSYYLHFCGAVIVSRGGDVGCSPGTMNLDYIANVNEGNIERLEVNFDPITHIGAFNTTASGEIRLSVDFLLMDMGVADGDVITVEGTVLDGVYAATSTATFTVATSAATTGLNIATTVSNVNGYMDIHPGGQAAYDLSLTLPPSSTFLGTTIEAAVAKNFPLRTGVCGVYSTDSCLHGTTTRTPFDLNPNYNEKVSFRLGTLINEGNTSVVYHVTVCVVLLDDGLVAGDAVDTNITLTYNGVAYDVGIVSSTYVGSAAAIVSNPGFNTYLTSPSANIMEGGVALFEMEVSVPKLEQTSFIAKGIAVSDKLSICRVKVHYLGNNIPCLTDDITEVFNKYTGSFDISDITMDLFSVLNIGAQNRSNGIEDLLVVEVAAQVREGFDYIAIGNISHDVDFSLTYDGTTVVQTKSLFVDTVSTAAPYVITPTVTITKVTSVNSITQGGAAAFRVEIDTPPGSIIPYTLELQTDSGKASICDVRVSNGGHNVPCINDDGAVQYFTQDGNITFDRATKVIGTVSNSAAHGASPSPEDKVIVEVVVSIPDSVTVSNGEGLTLDAKLTYGTPGTDVTDTFSFDAATSAVVAEANKNITVELVPSTGVTGQPFSIGEIASWNLTLVLPETADDITVNLQLPTDGTEALLSAIDAEISFAGRNIPCLGARVLGITKTSSLANSQMTDMSIHIGQVANVGTFKRYRFGSKLNEDDVLRITVRTQVTDHVANIHGAVHSVTCAVSSVGGAASSGSGSFSIQLSGSEIAEVLFFPAMEQFSPIQKYSGNTIQFSGRVLHSNTSNAHATNVTLHYRTPYYSAFVGLTNWTIVQPTVNILPSGQGIDVMFPVLLFTDDCFFEFNITIDPDREFPDGTLNIRTVAPVEMSYITYQRESRTDVLPHYSAVEALTFGFSAPMLCNDVIGIDTTPMQTCQYAASSDRVDFVKQDSAQGSASAWKPAMRGQPFCDGEYVQVYFGEKMKIKSFEVYSDSGDNLNYMKKFRFQHSLDSIVWQDASFNDTSGTSIFSVNFDDGSKSSGDSYNVSLRGEEIVTASYVRIIPTEFRDTCQPAVRVGFVGCSADVAPVADPCAWTQSTTYTVQPRLTHVQGSHIFACIEKDSSEEVQCTVSPDNGLTWMAMDADLGNVVGFNDNGGGLGISVDGESELCTFDFGVTWSVCEGEQKTNITSDASYATATVIPFDDFTGTSENNMYNDYGYATTVKITGTMGGIETKPLNGGSWSQLAWWGESDWTAL